MTLKHAALVAGSFAIVVIGCVTGYRGGYQWGFHQGQVEGHQIGENRFYKEYYEGQGKVFFSSQIQDARRRWSARNGLPPDRVDTGRTPFVMSFPDRDCVELKIPSGDLARKAIYCYKSNSKELLAEYVFGE